MIESVQKALEKDCGLGKDGKFLVGVSGGADSLALLDLLAVLGWNVIAGHFNHMLRDTAEEDAEFVRSFCRGQGIAFATDSADVAAYAQSEKLNLEQAARDLRYRFLFKAAESHDAGAVLVAHNADDQVETVLMHLLRGSGLSGLTGMAFRIISAWHPTIPLVRPLLGVWRDEIESYCSERGLVPRTDLSNLDTSYLRNRLRHETIPMLGEVENKFQQNILRMSTVLRAEDELLAELTETAWRQVYDRAEDDQIVLVRSKFLEQPVSLQRRLVRKALVHFREGLTDIGFDVIERARAAAVAPPKRRQIDLINNLRLIVEGDRLMIAKWGDEINLPDWPQMASAEPISLPVPGIHPLLGGWELEAEIFDRGEVPSENIIENTDPFTAYLDADFYAPSLILRGRIDGDLYRPLGMAGQSIKLSDLMINAKVPAPARPRLPIVVAGDLIAWVPGFQPSDDAKVTEGTKRILKISVFKK